MGRVTFKTYLDMVQTHVIRYRMRVVSMSRVPQFPSCTDASNGLSFIFVADANVGKYRKRCGTPPITSHRQIAPTKTLYQRVPTTDKAEIVIYTMYRRSRNVVEVFSCSRIAQKRSFFNISDFPVKVFLG